MNRAPDPNGGAPVEDHLEEGGDLLGEGPPHRVRAPDEHLVGDERQDRLAEVGLQPADKMGKS